jgi:hypothetical protein
MLEIFVFDKSSQRLLLLPHSGVVFDALGERKLEISIPAFFQRLLCRFPVIFYKFFELWVPHIDVFNGIHTQNNLKYSKISTLQVIIQCSH